MGTVRCNRLLWTVFVGLVVGSFLAIAAFVGLLRSLKCAVTTDGLICDEELAPTVLWTTTGMVGLVGFVIGAGATFVYKYNHDADDKEERRLNASINHYYGTLKIRPVTSD